MSSFTKRFEYKMVKGDLAEMAEDLTFYKEDNLVGEYACIPKGTRFNGATEPDWLKNGRGKGLMGAVCRVVAWDPWDRRMLPATVLHDWLVGEFGPKGKVGPNSRTLSWSEAAVWFDEALRVTDLKYGNVSWLQRKIMVNAVIVYGKFNGKK